jgi:hypothetical protein
MSSSIRTDVTDGLPDLFVVSVAVFKVIAPKGLNMSGDNKYVSDFPVRNMLHYVMSGMVHCGVFWK